MKQFPVKRFHNKALEQVQKFDTEQEFDVFITYWFLNHFLDGSYKENEEQLQDYVYMWSDDETTVLAAKSGYNLVKSRYSAISEDEYWFDGVVYAVESSAKKSQIFNDIIESNSGHFRIGGVTEFSEFLFDEDTLVSINRGQL